MDKPVNLNAMKRARHFSHKKTYLNSCEFHVGLQDIKWINIYPTAYLELIKQNTRENSF